MKVIIGRPDKVVAAVAAKASLDPVGSLGAWFLGIVFIVYSMGILSSQASTYYTTFPKDNKWLKRLVALTILISTFQMAIVFAVTWSWFVTSYGDWKNVVIVPWMVSVEPVVAHVNVIVAQMFFAYRCFVLTKRNWYILVSLLAAMITSLVLFTVMAVQLAYDPYFYSKVEPIDRLTTPGLIITILTDIAITAIMTWKLMTSRKGFNQATDSGLNKLIAVTWEAAALPAAMAITSLIVFMTMNARPILYSLFNILVPRLYVFSMMFTLNSRASLKEIFNGSTGQTSMSMDNIRNRRPDGTNGTHKTTAIVLKSKAGNKMGRDTDHTVTATGPHGSTVEVQVDVDKWELHDDDASEDLQTKAWTGDLEKNRKL